MRSRKKKFTMDAKFTRTKALPGISPLKLNKSLVAGEAFARRAGGGPVDTGFEFQDQPEKYIGGGKEEEEKEKIDPLCELDWDEDGVPNCVDPDPGVDPNQTPEEEEEEEEENKENTFIGPQLPPVTD